VIPSVLWSSTSLPARKKNEPLSDAHIDIAASLQVIFEEEVLKMTRFARKITRQTDLLFCGGCAQIVLPQARSAYQEYSVVFLRLRLVATWEALGAASTCSSEAELAGKW
jgi:predicted NodU family carbamoyl transferase